MVNTVLDKTDLITVTTGAAIQCTVFKTWLSSQQADICSEILCWIILPNLFRFDQGKAPRESRRIPLANHSTLQPISSTAIWIAAVSIGVLCFYKAESKAVALIPAVTPLLLFAQSRLQPETPVPKTSDSWFFAPLVKTLLGTTLAASFSILALAPRVAETVSSIAVVSLLVTYAVLTPSLARRGTMSCMDVDLKALATTLSSRVLIIMSTGLGIHTLLFGFPSGNFIATILLGFMKALSWYFTMHTTQYTSSWRIVTVIETFSITSTRDPFAAFSALHALSQVFSSFLALGQVIHMLPKRSHARSTLWGFLLIPLIPFIVNLYAIRVAQSSTPWSFDSSQHHPVETLAQKARIDFDGLLRKQSKNFTAAYQEYQHRYHMDPPPGFEDWYKFATLHQSPIIDDFDMIYDAISPFWKLSGNETLDAMRHAHQAENSELWYCRLPAGQAKTECKHHHRQFDRNIASLFDILLGEELGKVLSNVTFLVNHLDEPRILLPPSPGNNDGIFRQTTLSMQPTWNVVTKHCKAGRKIRRDNTPASVETYGIPFVTERASMMDLCQHPEYGSMHGLFISPTSFPLIEGLFPVLSTGSPSTMGDILFPSPAYLDPSFQYDNERDVDWERKHNNLYWAGSTTGGFASTGDWAHFHRQNFVQMAQNLQSRPHYYLRDREGVITRVASFFNNRLYDVAFTKIIQCAQPQCRSQKTYFTTKPWADRDQALRSRLVFDLDGNGISGRYYRLLASKSAPLKQTLFREWHDERLVPWVHYIPVSQSMEELPELVFYLTSTASGRKTAKDIAERGREWFAQSLRQVDMSIYVYRLLLEIARLQDPRRPVT